MNPSSMILFLFFFIVFTLKAFSFTTQKIPYFDHCNSYVPEANTTNSIAIRHPYLEPIAIHYTGGQNILDQDPTSQRSISFEFSGKIYATNVADTYKIKARLSFVPSTIYYRASNFTHISSNNSRVVSKYRATLLFNLDGFWSVSTNKLCMVGSASWVTEQGNPLLLNSVFKLRFPGYMTLNNSLLSGILESLASPDDPNYFDPISILGFPTTSMFEYNYTLVSNEEGNLVTKTKTPQDAVISMGSVHICSRFMQRFITYKLEYPSDCKNCSLFGQDHNGYLPDFMSLHMIQCLREDKKIRFLVEFRDRRFTRYDQSFQPNISLIGEGTWNGSKDELCIVACRILNQSDPLGSAGVGDCSIRLTLWFRAFRSIKKTHTTEGQIWNTRLTDDLGSFRMAKFQSFDRSRESDGMKYEYTEMEKVRHNCPKKKSIGAKYHFDYYGIDMIVKSKNMVSYGFAIPMFVGAHALNDYKTVYTHFSPSSGISTTTNGPLNISFEISFMLNISSNSKSEVSSLNLSTTNYDRRVKISAEGVYDDETGQICMVGCRNLVKNASFDCEIMVNFQLPRDNGKVIKGNIKSLREKNDVLYFEKLDIVSLTFSIAEAKESIWRMDLEIIMVLISNTLMCVFIGRQLFYLKKKPEMTNFISVLMMLILTFGHVVPLVLNFEALFSNTRNHENSPTGRNGLLEVNEVIVRIVTMVAFILQFRLLQITWNAKKNHWIHEIRTLVICLPIYFISGLIMLLVNWNNNTVWGGLRSYAGLTLDGFLFPQLILNIFQISKQNALSYSFFIGTTLVRLLPHAYDLYRGQEYISHQFDRLYIYANPRSDFYSPSWDIVIVCGGLVLAMIVFLQQHFGGRFMFPKRFQQHVEYDVVPVTSNE